MDRQRTWRRMRQILRSRVALVIALLVCIFIGFTSVEGPIFLGLLVVLMNISSYLSSQFSEFNDIYFPSNETSSQQLMSTFSFNFESFFRTVFLSAAAFFGCFLTINDANNSEETTAGNSASNQVSNTSSLRSVDENTNVFPHFEGLGLRMIENFRHRQITNPSQSVPSKGSNTLRPFQRSLKLPSPDRPLKDGSGKRLCSESSSSSKAKRGKSRNEVRMKSSTTKYPYKSSVEFSRFKRLTSKDEFSATRTSTGDQLRSTESHPRDNTLIGSSKKQCQKRPPSQSSVPRFAINEGASTSAQSDNTIWQESLPDQRASVIQFSSNSTLPSMHHRDFDHRTLSERDRNEITPDSTMSFTDDDICQKSAQNVQFPSDNQLEGDIDYNALYDSDSSSQISEPGDLLDLTVKALFYGYQDDLERLKRAQSPSMTSGVASSCDRDLNASSNESKEIPESPSQFPDKNINIRNSPSNSPFINVSSQSIGKCQTEEAMLQRSPTGASASHSISSEHSPRREPSRESASIQSSQSRPWIKNPYEQTLTYVPPQESICTQTPNISSQESQYKHQSIDASHQESQEKQYQTDDSRYASPSRGRGLSLQSPKIRMTSPSYKRENIRFLGTSYSYPPSSSLNPGSDSPEKFTCQRSDRQNPALQLNPDNPIREGAQNKNTRLVESLQRSLENVVGSSSHSHSSETSSNENIKRLNFTLPQIGVDHSSIESPEECQTEEAVLQRPPNTASVPQNHLTIESNQENPTQLITLPQRSASVSSSEACKQSQMRKSRQDILCKRSSRKARSISRSRIRTSSLSRQIEDIRFPFTPYAYSQSRRRLSCSSLSPEKYFWRNPREQESNVQSIVHESSPTVPQEEDSKLHAFPLPSIEDVCPTSPNCHTEISADEGIRTLEPSREVVSDFLTPPTIQSTSQEIPISGEDFLPPKMHDAADEIAEKSPKRRKLSSSEEDEDVPVVHSSGIYRHLHKSEDENESRDF